MLELCIYVMFVIVAKCRDIPGIGAVYICHVCHRSSSNIDYAQTVRGYPSMRDNFSELNSLQRILITKEKLVLIFRSQHRINTRTNSMRAQLRADIPDSGRAARHESEDIPDSGRAARHEREDIPDSGTAARHESEGIPDSGRAARHESDNSGTQQESAEQQQQRREWQTKHN